MKPTQRHPLDEGTFTSAEGKTQTLREHLVEQESTELQDAHDTEARRFNRAIRRGIKEPWRCNQKDKAIYSRHFTPREIEREEIKLMSTQAEALIRAMLNNPQTWLTTKTLCHSAAQDPKTAGPTVGRIVEFFIAEEPDTLIVRKVGHRREFKFNAEVDNLEVWTSDYIEKFTTWRKEFFRKQRKPERAPQQRAEFGPGEGKGKTVSLPSTQELHITVSGTISVLFGFARKETKP